MLFAGGACWRRLWPSTRSLGTSRRPAVATGALWWVAILTYCQASSCTERPRGSQNYHDGFPPLLRHTHKICSGIIDERNDMSSTRHITSCATDLAKLRCNAALCTALLGTLKASEFVVMCHGTHQASCQSVLFLSYTERCG